jgi:6-phosphogluconolactonase
VAPALSEIGRLPGAVTVRDDPAGVAAAAADWVVEFAGAAIAERGRFRIALAGGGTSRTLYQALAAAPHRERTDWGRWEVFFGDERACPPDDPASNCRMAREALLDLVPVAPELVHRMEAERADLDAAAAEYSSILASTCPAASAPGSAPRLDCVLLGLGENGHTASLFPGDPALQVRDRWAVRSRADYAPFDRITVTYPVLNAAVHVAFLVTGAAKGEALRGVVAGRVPAAGVRPQDGELSWFLDTAAADSI